MADDPEIVVLTKHVHKPRTTTEETCRDRAHHTIDDQACLDHLHRLELRAIRHHLLMEVHLSLVISSNLFRDPGKLLIVLDFVQLAHKAHRELYRLRICNDQWIKTGLQWLALRIRMVQETTINLDRVPTCNDVPCRSKRGQTTT
jgi:hypothetical protein